MSLMRDRFGWRHGLIGAFAVALTLSLPIEADAKRVGGGGSAGMKRSAPAQSSTATPPKQASQQQSGTQSPSPTQAAPAAGAAGAAAAAPARRSWMGPIAGLAAGLGLAALMSSLGLGEAFANFLMLALLGVAAVFLVVFLMRRFGRGAGSQPAMASAGPAGASSPSPLSVAMPPAQRSEPVAAPALERSAFVPAAADVSVTGRPLGQPMAAGVGASLADEPMAAEPAREGRWADPLVAPTLPEGFDLPAFERIAKMIFIRMQAANDAADLDDLRNFTTPEMFAALRLDIQDRGAKEQHTDVERVEASVVDFAQESGRHIVSVRFQGLIREEQGAPAEAFDEVWHLVKPEGDGSWAIAGIQQSH
jgi:predicted lipid-binding transport protein (Tim44 family)